MSESRSAEITNDLAIDLVAAGNWLWKEHKFRPQYQLRALTHTAAKLLGDRILQYNLSGEYLLGIENTLAALVLTERKRLNIFGVRLERSQGVAYWWVTPSLVAHFCARSVIVSVLRNFSNSAADQATGLYNINLAHLGLGIDGLIETIDRANDVSVFEPFFVSWSQDIAEHERFLREAT